LEQTEGQTPVMPATADALASDFTEKLALSTIVGQEIDPLQQLLDLCGQTVGGAVFCCFAVYFVALQCSPVLGPFHS
jgi:hypothetical protein